MDAAPQQRQAEDEVKATKAQRSRSEFAMRLLRSGITCGWTTARALSSMAPVVPTPPPRVLLVMPEQWPRALLRAELRERGYDALGAPGLAAALAYPVSVPERGPVRLILVDQAALGASDEPLLAQLLERHGHPASVLLTRRGRVPVGGAWTRVLSRPARIADLADAVGALLPLPTGGVRPDR